MDVEGTRPEEDLIAKWTASGDPRDVLSARQLMPPGDDSYMLAQDMVDGEQEELISSAEFLIGQNPSFFGVKPSKRVKP